MLVLKNIGKTQREVAKILNCGKQTVHRQLKKFKATGSFLDKKKTGRPKKISPDIGQQIVSWVEEDRRRSASLLVSMVYDKFDGLQLSDRAIRVMLRKHGYFGGSMFKKAIANKCEQGENNCFCP